MADIDDIVATIQRYFDGLYDGDLDKMRQAFHPCCHLYSAADDGVQDESVPDWFRRIEGRPSPASQGAARRDRIVLIDLNGPGSAFAKVQVAAPSGFYADYLSLLRLSEGWRIVAKVFAPCEDVG
jgi:hypothetical protein